MRRYNVWFSLGMIFLLAIQSLKGQEKQPAWITARPANPLYYIGIGSASKEEHPKDYHQVAKDQALQDLSSEIQVKISSDFIHNIAEKAGLITEDVQSRIRSTTKANLQGYELVDTWEDPHQYYVYYRLSKDTYKKLRQARLNKASSLAKDLYVKAGRQSSLGKVATAIRYYLQALASLQEFIAEPVEVTVGGKKIYLQNAVYGAIQDIFSAIRLQVNPKKITTKTGQALKKPIRVTASFQTAGGSSIPVAELPVEFAFVRGKGQLEKLVRTDNRGLANCHVSAVTSGEKLQIIRARVRPELFTEQNSSSALYLSLLKNLSIPQTRVLLTVSGLTAYIEASEENLGHKTEILFVEPRLKESLADSGLTFTDDPTNADIMITLKVRSRKGAKVYNLYSAFADLTLSVMSLSSGKEIFKKVLNNVKGIQLDYEKAGVKALENTGKKVEQLTPAIIKVIRE